MNTTNLSILSDDETARTHPNRAAQRAENLSILGVTRVLELCVGPSLETLEKAYAKVSIDCTGNDIDPRWRRYYPEGKWVIGDALSVDYSSFDAVIFAPPLSKGCTGKREDALKIQDVHPHYLDFREAIKRQQFMGWVGIVLPGRSMATRWDRIQLFKTLRLFNRPYIVEPLIEAKGARTTPKYYDVYFDFRDG